MRTNTYSIKCYVLHPSEELKHQCMELIERHHFIIDKGWENGHHIHLRGKLTEEQVLDYKSKLKKAVNNSISQYDKAAFKKQYTPIMNVLQKEEHSLISIHQNELEVLSESVLFENELYDQLFRKVNHIFDSYFKNSYFHDYSLYDLMGEMSLYHQTLKQFENTEGDAYKCHLSHYIGFLNGLSEENRLKIKRAFDNRFDDDFAKETVDFPTKSTELIEQLFCFIKDIHDLVDKKQLDFYAPSNREKTLQNIHQFSKRHQLTHSKRNVETFLYNPVIISNRWVMNALYKKMLLLNIKNLDRFYLNYVFARQAFPSDPSILEN